MKKLLVALMLTLLACCTAYAVGGKRGECSYKIHSSDEWSNKDADFRIRDGSIVITSNRRDRGEVEITSDHKLYVNGQLIVTDEAQDELLAEYYDLTMSILDEAKRLGLEGARIGAAGAAIGLQAVGGILKVLLTEYEFEQLEYELEENAEELEEQAEDIEYRADKLEYMADELADVHNELKRETPELRRLLWF